MDFPGQRIAERASFQETDEYLEQWSALENHLCRIIKLDTGTVAEAAATTRRQSMSPTTTSRTT
jgi:hypothetical protein